MLDLLQLPFRNVFVENTQYRAGDVFGVDVRISGVCKLFPNLIEKSFDFSVFNRGFGRIPAFVVDAANENWHLGA